MLARPTTLLAILTCCFTPCFADQAKQFEPDEHTMLLAHFEKTAKQADFSMGISQFCGNGARLTDEGYYGKAIDLTRYPLPKDFMTSNSDFTPRFDGWGFRGRGNISPWQGTYECWVKVADLSKSKPFYGFNLLEGTFGRNTYDPQRKRYVGFGLTLNQYELRYLIPTVGGELFEGTVNLTKLEGLNRRLNPDDWHHFAMTWSPGELVIYLDGRPLLSFDMEGQLGVAILNNPVRYMAISNIVMDELRISNVVRYHDSFEPGWRDGKRPEYAFKGNDSVKRYAPNTFTPAKAHATLKAKPRGKVLTVELGNYVLSFDSATGAIVSMSIDDQKASNIQAGLSLHRGIERQRLAPTALARHYLRGHELRFTQTFERNIAASHLIKPGDDALHWHVTLTNTGKEEAWIEPLLSLPVPAGHVDELFDNLEVRTSPKLPRHRDEYCLALPFIGASAGKQFVGVGIDPRVNMSDVVSEYAPSADGVTIRQGTKLALNPGESYTLDYVIVHGEGDFGALDAVAAYHGQFPEQYKLQSDRPAFTYMPMTQYPYTDKNYMDLKRVGMAGNFWGHGPGHDKGDEFGTADWWDNPKFYDNRAYRRYTQRIERMWGNVKNVHDLISVYYQRSYDRWYPVRRFHTCPDVTPSYIVEELWPGYKPNEDPLCFGQYYNPSYDWWIVNEYNTPIGAHFREVTRLYYRQTKGKCNGFINDMSHSGSLYRHNDPIAQQTPGRSYARDMGTFIRKAFGRRQRYEVLNGFVDDGSRMGMWSDGGSFSYTLGAFSDGMAIEGAAMYKDLTGSANYVISARNLVGEKPFSAMTHLNDDWVGYFLKAEDFTNESLRDYYRYCGRQLVLWGIKHGLSLDPTSYMFGRQFEMEIAPLMVESAVLGRKIVHGAEVNEPLWVRRNGNDLQTILTVGNEQPRAIDTDVKIYNRYFNGRPIFVGYFGGTFAHQTTADISTITNVQVDARDVAAFKAAALLETSADAAVQSTFSGDAINMSVKLTIDAETDGGLWLSDFGPMYDIHSVSVNGKPVQLYPGEPVALNSGKSEVIVQYQHQTIQFDAAQWARVELIQDKKPNFRIVASKSTKLTYGDDGSMSQAKTFELGFEHGTAEFLTDFLRQYDHEDGVVGNLGEAAFIDQPNPNQPGWTIVLNTDPLVIEGRVRIDEDYRAIYVEAATQGKIREAMMTFMRLVDRKYPHVGRFFPFRHRKQAYANDGKVPWKKWIVRAFTQDFYSKIEDKQFLLKPILRAEYEHLYADGNMDFAGKYQMRRGPRMIEPTFGDRFVYGYAGRATEPTKEQMLRTKTKLLED